MAVSVNEVLTLSFKGRASRAAYWWSLAVFVGLSIFSSFLLNVLPTAFDSSLTGEGWGKGAFSALNTALLGLFLLFQMVYLAAAVVRRLHDISYNGAAALFLLIPGVQLIVLILLGCFRGKKGLNRFGPDPLAIMTIDSAAPYRRFRDSADGADIKTEGMSEVIDEREVPEEEVLPAENHETGTSASDEFIGAGAIYEEARRAVADESPSGRMQVKLKAVERLQKLLKGGKISQADFRLWQRRVMQLP